MSFWTYMLQCADRHFYVGHTDDLETRIGQHQTGHFKGQTSTRLPVHLVWSDEFPTRYEALTMERRIKGWSRLKKLALIRGDWVAISALARGAKGEGRASTSSARTVWERWTEGRFLHPHPSQLPSQPFGLEISVRQSETRVQFDYQLTGQIDILRFPEAGTSGRQDELWKHTCFEAFLQLEQHEGYLELNFAPSTKWAAYRFDSYREGMSYLDLDPPRIRFTRNDRSIRLRAEIALPQSVSPTRIGLSAVIEEVSGAKSYWALAHPPGDAPDFHHPDCFAIELPPASAT